jgi:hypothetical protein
MNIKYEDKSMRTFAAIRDELHEMNRNLKHRNDLLGAMVYIMRSKNITNNKEEGEDNE